MFYGEATEPRELDGSALKTKKKRERNKKASSEVKEA